jgi:hypothetical protein
MDAATAALLEHWRTAERFAAAAGLDRVAASHYIECRLGAARDQIDYLCAFPRARANITAAALERYRARVGVPRDHAWCTAVRVLEAWSSGESALAARVPFLWLEFDDVGDARPCAALSVSACLVPGYRNDRPVNPTVIERDLQAVKDVLGSLEVEADRQLESLLSSCFENLPAPGRWIHASVMWGRTPRAIKLYGVMPRTELRAYLEKIGWAGNFAALEDTLARAYGSELLGHDVFVDLNLDDFRDPRRCTLGLEASQQQWYAGREGDRGRANVLARWVDQALATELDAGAIKAWIAADSSAEIQKFLDLKLVLQRTELSAKAYLGAYRRPSFSRN